VLTAACLPFLALRDGPADLSPPPSPRRRAAGRIARLLLAAFALAGIWRLPGELAFQQFDHALQTRQPLPRVWERGRKAARLLPTNSNPDRILARVAEATGNGPGAVDAYERAVRRSPHRAALWASLARARLAAGDLEGAGGAIALAVEWNPGFPRYQAHLAMLRALRTDASPAPARAALVAAALAADYHLEAADKTAAMTVRIAWPADLPPPKVPLDRLAVWLAPHAGVFPGGSLPVCFHARPAWTNAN
jgi:tetratricopeptide (TPR) repeat protein